MREMGDMDWIGLSVTDALSDIGQAVITLVCLPVMEWWLPYYI